MLLLPMLLASTGQPSADADPDAVPGRMIIQLDQRYDDVKTIGLLEDDHHGIGLKMERCLSASLGIWLFYYDPGSGTKRSLLSAIGKNKAVVNIQFDHYLSPREVIPDDQRFLEQWALRNLGQSGGTPDADIDASDAWTIAVNTGATCLGDSMVIAVVDDGFSLIHEDMYFWKNRNEIPGNGIDDDGNGYVDDYDGWNGISGSGEIPSRSHGMHVAGIAGARGNNSTGVSGVNWNCAVMPVVGSSTFESFVVAAYAYVYDMRALYDESAGTKGAFVVVTNSSFGVDFADPEDYPVWGAMYDSLGSLGIVNVAATMNKPYSVEEMGDVPTSFDTDHLIAVTSTTNHDGRYSQAAWGKVSIDLGAPGVSILSTTVPNDYGYKTGTSMASPHVAGGVALMFAAADEAFIHTYFERPGEMAVFMKKLLLDGVDTLNGFDTLCVSGGRLNVDGAVRRMVGPRLWIPADTFRISLAPDSSATGYLVVENLLGFEMPFVSGIANMPAWISLAPAADTLAGHGTDSLRLDFDATAMEEGNYYCNLEVTDIAGMTNEATIEMTVDPSFGIRDTQNRPIIGFSCFPNPFAAALQMGLEITQPSFIRVDIYALSGLKVNSWNEQAGTGKHIMVWDGKDAAGKSQPAGVYIVNISVNGYSESIRVIRAAK